jgi:class 3 adenylate cyclase
MSGQALEILTFLFTDLQGSSALWEEYPTAMAAIIQRHDTLLATLIKKHEGELFKLTGDGVHASFKNASHAVAAALAIQKEVGSRNWGDVGTLRARVAIHTGVAEKIGADYYGRTINRVGRILEMGHGGQILLSRATVQAVGNDLPPNTTLKDLNEQALRDLQEPERIFQLEPSDLHHTFPPLRNSPYALNEMQSGQVVGAQHRTAHPVAESASDELLSPFARDIARVTQRIADATRLLMKQRPSERDTEQDIKKALHLLVDAAQAAAALHQRLCDADLVENPALDMKVRNNYTLALKRQAQNIKAITDLIRARDKDASHDRRLVRSLLETIS